MLEKSIPIEKAKTVQVQVKNLHDQDINLNKVRQILKKETGLLYRRAHPVALQCNSERCLVMRQ